MVMVKIMVFNNFHPRSVSVTWWSSSRLWSGFGRWTTSTLTSLSSPHWTQLQSGDLVNISSCIHFIIWRQRGKNHQQTSLSSFVCTKIMNIYIMIITLMFRVAKDDHGRAGRILLPHRLVFFIQSVQVNINHALDIKLTLPCILLFILPLLNLLLALSF